MNNDIIYIDMLMKETQRCVCVSFFVCIEFEWLLILFFSGQWIEKLTKRMPYTKKLTVR